MQISRYIYAYKLKHRHTDGHVSEIPGMNWRTSIFIFELKGLPAKLPSAYFQTSETEVTLSCCPSRDQAGVGLATACSPGNTPVSCAHGRHHSSHISWDITPESRQGLVTLLNTVALPVYQSWQKREVMIRHIWRLVIRRPLEPCFSQKWKT